VRVADLLVAVLLCSAAPALAQSERGGPVAGPVQLKAIPLGTGNMRGATVDESWISIGGQRAVRNVREATLTPILPDPARATGAAVIVAPGGGFVMLSMESEGLSVARWLADHGIAAFVLKYRLRQTPADQPGFMKALVAVLARASGNKEGEERIATPDEPAADAIAALKLVRARAGEWHIDPARIGLLGFSAGAMTALGVVEHSAPDTMPAFVAPIYGSMAPIPVPADAPPLFTALALDDPLFGKMGYGLVQSWQAARRPAELHVYQSGGHGFGLGKPGTTSTSWIESFRLWLDTNGFLGRPRK